MSAWKNASRSAYKQERPRNETVYITLPLGGSISLSQQTGREELAMKYLLGTLSEEERSQFEERYFSDDAEFEEIEIAEDELIDKYVRNELSTPDNERFEQALARSPRLMDRVQTARVFADRLRASDTIAPASPVVEQTRDLHEKRSWWSNLFGSSATPQFALAFSVLLLLIGGLALLFGWLRLNEQSIQLANQQAALEQRQRELNKQAADLKNQLEQLANSSSPVTPTETPNHIETPTPQSGRSFVAMILSPGGTRGGGSESTIHIPPGTQYVRMTLNVRDTDYSSYNAVVRIAEQTPISSSSRLTLQRTRSGAVVVFSIAANRLQPGDYVVELSGRTPTGTSESVDEYQFRIVK